VESDRIRPRLGFRAHQHRGTAELISGDVMSLNPIFYRPNRKGPPLDPAPITADLIPVLRPHVLPGAPIELRSHWDNVIGFVETADPIAALAVLVDFARSRGLNVWMSADPQDRLVSAIARIAQDLGRRG
jgi:hypothetical protein